MIDLSETNNILIVLPDMIGLTVVAQPAVKQITEFYKNKAIKLVGFRNVSETLLDEKMPAAVLLNLNNTKAEIISYLSSSGPFDIVFDFLSSRESGEAVNTIGIPLRLGRDYPDTDFYNIKVPSASQDKSVVSDYLEFLATAGISNKFNVPVLVTSEKTRSGGLDWLRSHGINKEKLVVMGVGGGNKRKQWPLANYLKLKQQLEMNGEVDVVFIVGPKEEHLYEEIRFNDPQGVIALNLPLEILKGVISQACYTICNDYAVMHISASVGVPTIAVFLSSDPVQWFPYVSPSKYFIKDDVSCRPCYREDCQEWKCNNASLFNDVAREIKKLDSLCENRSNLPVNSIHGSR